MNRRKRQKARVEITLPPPVENLRLALSSPRERAKGTIDSYVLTATNFIRFAGKDTEPDKQVARKYFVQRRKDGAGERTLRKEFVHLKKLYLSNNWKWPFTIDDQPQPSERAEAPALTEEEIATLIRSRDEYSPMENFCLAVSTTWGSRAEEIVKIRKKDYPGELITIRLAKRRREIAIIQHIIPEEIRPILLNCHPKLTTTASLHNAFQKMLLKSGIGERNGYGYHSIRRALRTLLERNLARAGLPLSLVGEFMGWAPTTTGIAYGGAPMLGVYSHPEILSNEPFAVDKLVLPHHPFLFYYKSQSLFLSLEFEPKI